MRWRHIYKSALVVLACAFSGITVADERILSFDETVTVNADGSMYVREVIRVRAEGNKIRRGIFRDFPTTYSGKDGHRYVVEFAFQGASRDGRPEKWHSEDRSNGVRIYLGSKDALVSRGEHTYELVFRTDRQLGYFAEHDELYWNVTGNGWDFPIDRVTSRVELPPAIPVADIRLEAYTGRQGAKGKDYTAEMQGGSPFFTSTRAFRPQEGLTIVVMWPKGFIMPPVESAHRGPSQRANNAYVDPTLGWSPAERVLGRKLHGNNLPALLALVGLALLMTYYYLIWVKVGRDPPSRITIPEYEMPKDQSAASMRYLMRMGYDDTCFAAAVLSLAVKGRLRIEEESGLLGLGRKFTLHKVKSPNAKPIPADEQRLLKSLFSSSDTLVLKNDNYRRIAQAQSSFERALKTRFSSGFFAINGGWHMLGIVLSLVLAVPAFVFPGRTDNWPEWHFTTVGGWFTLAMMLAMLVANGVFGKLLKAPTVAGQAIMDHIRGFKMYLEVAEGEELKRMKGLPPPMTPQLFESYLPAALALGVEQRWAERFAAEFNLQSPNYEPSWYVGQSWNIANMGNFSRELGTSLSSAISSSSQAPGSSSGGGGGGSSGGGGGGGGGGGW
jgi:uncharacterized membrane protein YgcG